MRTVNWFVVVIVLLPQSAWAQADPSVPAPDDAPAADVSPAAPAQPVAPAPPAAPAAPAPPAAPPAAAAPPAYTAPPAYYAPPAYAQPAAPPPGNFTPQASPLLPNSNNAQPRWNPQPAAPVYPPAYSQYPVYQAPPPRVYNYQPAPDPALTLPPLPPGYVYAPVPRQNYQNYQLTLTPGDLARREQLYNELHLVDSRLDELQRDHVRLGGPIAMMVVGYGAAVISAWTALAAFSSAEAIQRGDYRDDGRDGHLDYNNSGVINHTDERHFRKLAHVSAGISGAALLFAIIGTSRLVKRKALKRDHAAETRQLSAQRDNLRRQLDFGASAAAGQVGVSVSGRY